MNKTQKCATAILVITLLLLIFSITIPIAWFNNIPIIRKVPLFLLILTYVVMGLSIIILRRKKSSSEVDYDERDAIIKQKAIFVSYITLWILVFMACTVPFVIGGRYGIKPSSPMTADGETLLVSLLPIVLFLMFVVVMLVYSLTILIQYGWAEKGAKL